MSLVRIYTASDTGPIASLYGDAGDHETILRYLDCWYSTPDAKVNLTERASGDGAHDVYAEYIIYGARTIVVGYRILTDSRTRLLAHESSLLSLAHQNVRFRVTDDASDLFASGYVDSVVKDKSQQNLAKQTETGTLTIVCPRPERLAWNPLQSQLFPVSVMQGGLRYSTTHELVSAWTGTANASASTLSKDGAVIATNLDINPSSLTKRNIWQATATQNADGTWTYSKGSASEATVYLTNLGNIGDKLYVKFKEDISTRAFNQDNMKNLVKIDNYSILVTCTIADQIYFTLSQGSLTPIQNIRATPSDYAALQSLGIDWFSGDTYPVPTGKGLSYPLKYGTAGASSNVALLLNNGSSTAFPVLTVTGSFPNGVQIQWGGNALQYDGVVGAVPLILDSRSQTASMGGVDVSRNLSRRDFPTIPAAGSVSLRLMSAGTGWVTAVCRDTYI